MHVSYLESKGSKKRILTKEAFVELFSSSSQASFTDQFAAADEMIRKNAPKVTQGALSNVHGAWYEWILGRAFWNYFKESQSAYLAVKLPNVTSFDVADLFEKNLRRYILDLREKVIRSSGVELVTSNPDFIIFDPSKVELPGLAKEPALKEYSLDGLKFLDSAYKGLVGKCNFDTIIGFMASKTSFRPDRRLQIPHEGSLMKAIYAHLVTREWELSPRGLKYYAVACNVGEPDRRALKTVATHSITTVSDLPKAAVDEVFRVNCLPELQCLIQSTLTPMAL